MRWSCMCDYEARRKATLSYRCIWRRTRLSAEGFRCDTTSATADRCSCAAVQLTVA